MTGRIFVSFLCEKISDYFLFGSHWPTFKIAEVDPVYRLSRFEANTVYKLVNAITCEMVDPASHNSVCGFFTER